MNPMAGCGMQQARRPGAEETVEVVGNHEDGTSGTPGRVLPKGNRRPVFGSGQRERSRAIVRWKPVVWEWTRRVVEAVREDGRSCSRIAGEGATWTTP